MILLLYTAPACLATARTTTHHSWCVHVLAVWMMSAVVHCTSMLSNIPDNTTALMVRASAGGVHESCRASVPSDSPDDYTALMVRGVGGCVHDFCCFIVHQHA
jgi:hypothetical protein